MKLTRKTEIHEHENLRYRGRKSLRKVKNGKRSGTIEIYKVEICSVQYLIKYEISLHDSVDNYYGFKVKEIDETPCPISLCRDTDRIK